MITFYLERLHGWNKEWAVIGYCDGEEISRETFFELYYARMHLLSLEDDGNVCIDTTMTGY